MKKHQFRLQNYLKIKEFDEKISWTDVLKQEARIHEIQDQIHRIVESQKNSHKKSTQIGLRAGPQLYELDLTLESIAGLDVRLRALQTTLAQEEKILERLKQKHIEAKKELKIVEKLKANDEEKFKIFKNKQDEKRTNEVAQQVYLKGKK